MKNTVKKAFALLLIICLVLSTGGICAVAESVYPESEHDYQNDIKQEWHYEYETATEGLYVTFSDKTSFEKPTLKPQIIISGSLGVIGGTAMKETKKGDKLIITADGYTYSVTGKELAGKTIYIPGNSFGLCLETDSSVVDYGFAIDRISHIAPDDVAVVTYYCCDTCGTLKSFCYNQGDEIKIGNNYYCNLDNSAFVSWIGDDGTEYYEGETLPFASVNLKARRIPLLLGSDEVLCFSNSDPYFDPEYDGGYDISKEDYRMMQKNIYRVFGIGVLPAVGLSIALATYPNWYWNGSCYGMSTLAFLQHYGALDVLDGKGAKSLSELTNDEDTISMINYYQWAASGSFLCENFSLKKGSKMYSQQLKNLYESVADGNIVMLTYYSGETFKTSGHTVLLTGAYTQKDGTKVLVTYDCNRPEDYTSKAFEQRFYIDADYTSLKRGYDYPTNNWYMEYGEFNWTDDYDHFKAFDINGGGKVFTWYSHYFSQMANLIRTLFSLIKL